MNITVLTTIFPRYNGDYRGSFISFLAKALSKYDSKTKITVLAPSSKNSMKKERWGKLLIIRFQYWLPQSKQLIAYSEND